MYLCGTAPEGAGRWREYLSTSSLSAKIMSLVKYGLVNPGKVGQPPAVRSAGTKEGGKPWITSNTTANESAIPEVQRDGEACR